MDYEFMTRVNLTTDEDRATSAVHRPFQIGFFVLSAILCFVLSPTRPLSVWSCLCFCHPRRRLLVFFLRPRIPRLAAGTKNLHDNRTPYLSTQAVLPSSLQPTLLTLSRALKRYPVQSLGSEYSASISPCRTQVK